LANFRLIISGETSETNFRLRAIIKMVDGTAFPSVDGSTGFAGTNQTLKKGKHYETEL